MMPLLNFGVLVGLSLLVLFWFIGRKPPGEKLEVVTTCEQSVTIKADDNCWDIAQVAGMSVDEILGINTGLDCSKLTIGHTICLSREVGDDLEETVS